MNSTLTLVTPDKAQALLALCYQGQRPLRQHHVRFLRHLMRTGHWRQGAEIHCARVEGERFLVNGQHTLTALVQEGLASWLTVVEIDVPTLAGIGRLYEAFDRNMTRSLDDIYQSDPEIGRYGWTAKQLKAMSGAVALLATGFAQEAGFADIVLTLRDPFVRAELLRDWSREATEAFGAMQGQLRRYLLRSGGLCRKVAFWRQNATIRYWKINGLRASTFLFSVICDRAPASPGCLWLEDQYLLCGATEPGYSSARSGGRASGQHAVPGRGRHTSSVGGVPRLPQCRVAPRQLAPAVTDSRGHQRHRCLQGVAAVYTGDGGGID
jgi:hypothetical protein